MSSANARRWLRRRLIKREVLNRASAKELVDSVSAAEVADLLESSDGDLEYAAFNWLKERAVKLIRRQVYSVPPR